MIRVIVFDFDGTLVDSNRIKERCLHAAVRRLAGGEKALAAARVGGGDRYQIFHEVARRIDPSGEATSITKQGRALAGLYSQCCERGIVAAPERRGAKRALALLKRWGLRLWVVSATPAHDLPRLLRRRGLTPLLAGAFGSPATKVANMRRVMAIERRRSREILVVGDGADDLDAARAIGAHFVAVTAERRLAHRGPYALNDLTKLVPLVARLRA